MSAPKHTPGPWVVATPSDAAIHQRLRVVASDYDNVIAMLMMRDGEQWANAHLVAAAPELLAALKSLKECETAGGPCDVAGVKCDCHEMAEAAIAKAEGRS